jgi:DNA-binding LytR/AlgR family response regulator
MVLINPLLFVLGFSSSPFNESFVEKYITGTAVLHLSIYWLAQFIYWRPEINEKDSRRIKVIDGATQVFVQHSDIAWIESADHYLEIATENRKYLLRSTMSRIAASLPPEFIRIHRRYVIHIPYVDQIRKKGRVMEISIGEEILPVSRTFQKRVLNKC